MKEALLAIAFVALSSSALAAVDEDPNYRDQISSKVKAATVAVSEAKSDTVKLDEIKKLKAEVESERARIRKELDSAKETKTPAEKLTQLDARDTEILRIHFSLEPVFVKSLAAAFSENGEFRRKACNSLPQTIRFGDMAGMPDDSNVPASTQLALDLVKALCEAKPSPK